MAADRGAQALDYGRAVNVGGVRVLEMQEKPQLETGVADGEAIAALPRHLSHFIQKLTALPVHVYDQPPFVVSAQVKPLFKLYETFQDLFRGGKTLRPGGQDFHMDARTLEKREVLRLGLLTFHRDDEDARISDKLRAGH